MAEREEVVIEYQGEEITLEVPAGTSDADIKSFIRQNEPKPSFSQRTAANLAEVNRGLAGLLDFPVSLVNAAIQGIDVADRAIAENLLGRDQSERAAPPQLPTPFTEAGLRIGAFPEERPDGLLPRFFELLGASTVPFAGAVKGGEIAMRALTATPSALQQIGIVTASQPGKAAAWDIAANFSAAAGGTVARGFTDNESTIAMAELGASFLPTAVVLLPRVTPGGQAVQRGREAVQETLAPFTEAGARPKAARRLQSVAADPEAAAAAVSEGSLLPPFQQTGDPNLIKLQNNILDRNPALRQEYSEQLQNAMQALKSQADFGGDIQRARHLLNVRSQQAVEEAAIAVERLGTNATPRQISVAATRATQRALDDAIEIEKAIWNRLDTKAPATIDNAKDTLDSIIAARSPDADPADIPAWLVNKLREPPIDKKTLQALERQGFITEGGIIDPAIRAALERQGVLVERQRTLADVQEIRSRVLRESRSERAKDAPNRKKLGILNDVQKALLDDMSATGVDGVDEARAFSNQLNQRYRRGRVGRLLGFDVTGAERVAAEDVLDEVVFGRHSTSTSQRFIEASNEAPEEVLRFIKQRYLEATSDGATINAGAHDRFISNLRKKGMFELFPELEGQLNQARTASDRARLLEVPEGQVNTTRVNQGQSRAALLLQADPGKEMSLILRSNNPQAAIRDAMKVVKGDARAVQGLKSAFADEVMSMSAGRTVDEAGLSVPNGLAMKRLLGEYKPVMDALQMTRAERSRLDRIAEQIRLAQVKQGTGEIGTGILDDPLLAPVDLLARYVGARTGGNLGDDMGSRLVLAQFMSKQSRDRIRRLTVSKAEELLIEAYSDPELFKALLVGPTASAPIQQKAARTLENALLRLESSGRRALAIAATTEEENE